MVLQSAFQVKLSFIITVRGMLGGGSGMVCQFGFFKRDRSGSSIGSYFHVFVNGPVVWYVFMAGDLDEDGGGAPIL